MRDLKYHLHVTVQYFKAMFYRPKKANLKIFANLFKRPDNVNNVFFSDVTEPYKFVIRGLDERGQLSSNPGSNVTIQADLEGT